jgi:HPt (histidine-containing phosphotransfer) domain-containing protein
MSLLDPAPAIFDARAVRSLTGHSEDRAFARVFVSRYRQLLPLRVRRIACALQAGEVDEAMDAVLSLKSASSTLGAGELVDLGSRIEECLRRDDLVAATTLAGALPGAARRTERALTAFLGG